MHLSLWFIFIIALQFTGTGQGVLRSSFKNDRNLNPISTENWSNETHFTWILYRPWKRRNDLFNDKPYNNSVEYFGISEEDRITNESYIETSKLTVCKEVNLTFYSKVNSIHNNVNLILFIYKQNIWNKEWEYINNDSQWQLHQLKIPITDKNEDIQLRFVPISNFIYRVSIAIAVLDITTHTNCQKLNQTNKSQLKNHSHSISKVSVRPFLLIIFASAFVLIFTIFMIICVYGIITKRYNQWRRKRSGQRRKKRRKSRNAIEDEPTIMGEQTDIV